MKNACELQDVASENLVFFFFFFKVFIYLFLERGEASEKEREGNIDVREKQIGCFLCTSSWGPGLQPRRVP